MSDKKKEKLTYALTESSAVKQITEANQLRNRAKTLLKTYMCEENPLKYSTRFFIDVLERQLFSGERIKNKKTGEDNIIVPYEDFALISSYLVVTAARENDLESLGISMRLH